MNLWKLEWFRLWRSYRLLILLAVFGVFGLLGPITAKYLPILMESLGEDAVGSLPPMTPPDAISQYIGNAVQMGVLAVAFVGAAALAFDAKPEMSIFLRTRASIRDILLPRFLTVSAAAAVTSIVGMAIAYVGAGILLEWLDAGAVALGAVLFALYLVFAVAVISFVASLVRRVPAVALLSVGTLIFIAVLGVIGPLAPWLPTDLIGAIDGLVRGAEVTFWRSVVVTLLSSVGLVVFAIRRLSQREI